ncbi:S8 family serine peptidase [Bacteriovorax sp. BSW11_IV]|uniref:S8 family serine peptidase n=1 Tax=Bacteriovorax sp. BSW11_IV TaxID=1353529 RepID=UPI00041786DE|nr:S8 family serine peptidase [Bacteriovorax sp. BSW11_IV]
MLKSLLTTLFLATMSTQSLAATIAIIDSGTDMKHQDIAPIAWTNSVDTTVNNRDEDRNGYQDDIYGWNFAEGNNLVIDYKYLGLLNDDIRNFFAIQTKMFLGTVTEEEMSWVRAKVNDADFIARISKYGNFMHGTHVAGIATRDIQSSKMFAVKLIPTEVNLPGDKAASFFPMSVNSTDKGLGEKLVKMGLKQLAKAQMTMMEEIAAYVDGHKADVANGSFGTGFNQAKQIVEMVLKDVLRTKPSDEQVDEYAKYFVNQLVENGRKMMDAAPNTLFVFAAGNDGMNNDLYPTSPTNIQAPNEISVAATLDFNSLAPFSNYGEREVDVAAPGVSIESAVPGDQYLKVSGTSQAAPYVANVAALILEKNSALRPVQVKEIIMATVDVKSWLGGKVKTSGIVNKERAVVAAELSKSVSLSEAISRSLNTVSDVESDEKSMFDIEYIEGSVLPLPSEFKL